MCIESSSVFCEPILWILLFAAAFCAVGYWLVSTGKITFKISKNTEEVISEINLPEPVLNDVEKELINLGFADFTMDSAIKYFGLDKKCPFEITAYYENDWVKVKIKIGDIRVVYFDIDMSDVSTFEISDPQKLIVFNFSRHHLQKKLNTEKYKSASELLKKINWGEYVSEAEYEIYATSEDFKEIFS